MYFVECLNVFCRVSECILVCLNAFLMCSNAFWIV